MNTIDSKLTTSGNSVAVRLPKALLEMSGLGSRVKLEAKNGKIIISKSLHPRDGWSNQIQALVAKHGDPADEFKDMHASIDIDLGELPWEGITFEEWKKDENRAKLS